MFQLIKQDDTEKNLNSEFGINKEVQRIMANGNTQFIIRLANAKQLKLSYSMPTIALQIAAKFFHLKCYIHYDRFLILAACLLLATKIKDMEMKIKNLCFAFHSVMCELTSSSIPVDENIIEAIRNQIIIAESQVLRTLQFQTQCVSPHQFVKKYCDICYGNIDKNERNGNSNHSQLQKTFQTTKILILDSNRVQASLYFSPLIIFISCFLIASRYDNQKPYIFSGIKKYCKNQNPSDEEMYYGWLQMISINEGQPIRAQSILECINLMNSLLEYCGDRNNYQH